MIDSVLCVVIAVLAVAVSPAAAADGPHKVTIDAERRLCVDGEPFFPIGIYNVPQDKLEHAKELGFNTVHTYSGEGGKDRKGSAAAPEAMKAYLDAAGKLGLKVYMGLPRYEIVQGDMKSLEARITHLKDSSALLAWYSFDEPYHEKVPAARLQAVTDLIRKLDGNRPIVLVLCLVANRRAYHEQHPEYLDSADIIMTDPYPCRGRGSRLDGVSGEILVTRKLVSDKKPVWNVLQLHGKGPGGAGYGLAEPNAAELRNMTYQSLAAGVKGLSSFAYAGSQFALAKSPEGLKNVKSITSELRELAPVILSDEPKALPVIVEKNPALLSRVWVHDGKAYVIAVNLLRADTTVTVAPAAGALPGEVKVLFEKRSLEPAGGKVSEKVEPLGVRVYEVALPKAG